MAKKTNLLGVIDDYIDKFDLHRAREHEIIRYQTTLRDDCQPVDVFSLFNSIAQQGRELLGKTTTINQSWEVSSAGKSFALVTWRDLSNNS